MKNSAGEFNRPGKRNGEQIAWGDGGVQVAVLLTSLAGFTSVDADNFCRLVLHPAENSRRIRRQIATWRRSFL